MPIINFKDKSNVIVKTHEFQATGKPLPRNVQFEDKVYSYESRQGNDYVYKEVPK